MPGSDSTSGESHHPIVTAAPFGRREKLVKLVKLVKRDVGNPMFIKLTKKGWAASDVAGVGCPTWPDW
jgi:hypothetical protein